VAAVDPAAADRNRCVGFVLLATLIALYAMTVVGVIVLN
jgi:hypothetical protein